MDQRYLLYNNKWTWQQQKQIPVEIKKTKKKEKGLFLIWISINNEEGERKREIDYLLLVDFHFVTLLKFEKQSLLLALLLFSFPFTSLIQNTQELSKKRREKMAINNV